MLSRIATVLVCAAVAAPSVAAAQDGAVELISQTPAGTAGNAASGVYGLAVSRYGGAVAFSSAATDLVAADPDAVPDIYVRYRPEAATVLASVTAAGEKANAISTRPSLALGGRRVAFLSAATNLDPADADPAPDAYLKHLRSGRVRLVSQSAEGVKADAPTGAVAIAGNGRSVAFTTRATNLDPRASDGGANVYVWDLTGRVRLASVAADGSRPAGPAQVGGVSLSRSGRWVAFSTDAALDPADDNGVADIYVKDIRDGDLRLASGSGDAPSVAPAISARGDAVVFSSFAADLVPEDRDEESDVYRSDVATGALSLVSTSQDGVKGDDSSSMPALSGDGRTVAFASWATNLAPGPAGPGIDVYVKDLATGAVVNASGPAPEEPAGVVGLAPALTIDGSSVAFTSNGSHFTPADTNTIADVYLRRLR
jgi:Tol biopolymer transport system component